ncbi:tRNA (5-methylaminomethyl-2-thiouridine)(34)-methyltransferase MnmD [Mucilaginibacter auburnensis]|uniref:tRNA U34 5-methylaminomethyl-2-thiouridine-forming methyltransferase MnmC n=1 Tax=Mucilaginibacter auburnensis TaxID=1457233 RepID=A0A2H9VUA6_9SPHI|nr:tRNA (5-methylaminomethyl-2-thiouridine)(34)-methyltransferase MnmD [Mucilaginibacter auburnensis]PJJ84395.1 tRNA U34 5-methylaminomethyl-2-thiouridine-forming methyltransferase MnmC [Mucilaginibacter auburnensis]
MTPELKIVTTADGSNTIYNPQVGENYHSRHGALQESRHVFLGAGLEYFLNQNEVKEVSVLEVGFGTGLNFLLTAEYCTSNQIKLNYKGIEAYPLTKEMISQTAYEQYVPTSLWDAFMAGYEKSLKEPVQLTPHCQLQIAHCQLLDFKSDTQYNVIYFDAFAAIHQPEMWSEEAISHTVKFLKPGGVFVTYAITGNLKRMLKAMGLQVQKVPGAPGKREMLRAVKSR